MIATIARVMWLGLWRDRGALALAFALPPLMFLVFAEVFSGAGDEDFTLRIALLDSAGTPRAAAVAEHLAALDGLDRIATDATDGESLEALVRAGQVDAAVWIRREPGAADPPEDQAAIVIIGDGARALAAAVLAGRVQRLLQTEFPSLEVRRAVALVRDLSGPFGEPRESTLQAAIDRMESDDADESEGSGDAGTGLEQRLIGGGRDIDPGISYYAGAVAILFLLFAAMQGAISLIDERTSGIIDRLVAGPGGIGVVVIGKGVFLTVQGLLQCTLIFAVAWLLYDLEWPRHLGPWLVTALLAASVAAWGGLLLASLCRTRQQAQTASAFVVLILSAVGGSMVPRFLMPGWLRDLGWLTPNAWVIESWQGMFWRGETLSDLAPGWAVLTAAALIAMLLTVWLARRNTLAK